MGWDFTKNATKNDIVRQVLTPYLLENGAMVRPIAHKVVKQTLWVVLESVKDGTTRDGTEIICFFLKNEKRFGWGYKGIPESAYPFDYSCPMEFLRLAPVTCQPWRDAVAEWHAIQSRVFAIGEHVTLVDGCRPSSLTITSVKPLLGVSENGKTFRVKPDQIKA